MARGLENVKAVFACRVSSWTPPKLRSSVVVPVVAVTALVTSPICLSVTFKAPTLSNRIIFGPGKVQRTFVFGPGKATGELLLELETIVVRARELPEVV